MKQLWLAMVIMMAVMVAAPVVANDSGKTQIILPEETSNSSAEEVQKIDVEQEKPVEKTRQPIRQIERVQKPVPVRQVRQIEKPVVMKTTRSNGRRYDLIAVRLVGIETISVSGNAAELLDESSLKAELRQAAAKTGLIAFTWGNSGAKPDEIFALTVGANLSSRSSAYGYDNNSYANNYSGNRQSSGGGMRNSTGMNRNSYRNTRPTGMQYGTSVSSRRNTNNSQPTGMQYSRDGRGNILAGPIAVETSQLKSSIDLILEPVDSIEFISSSGFKATGDARSTDLGINLGRLSTYQASDEVDSKLMAKATAKAAEKIVSDLTESYNPEKICTVQIESGKSIWKAGQIIRFYRNGNVTAAYKVISVGRDSLGVQILSEKYRPVNDPFRIASR